MQAEVVESTGLCNTNNPTAPCYANIEDILQGQRRLWPIDDLVLTTSFFPDQSQSLAGPVNSFLLNTANSAVPNLSSLIENQISTDQEPSFATAIGRMFNLPKDVIVTMTSNILNVSVQAPNSFDIGFPLQNGIHPIGLAMADFTGDGFDDMVVYFSHDPGSDTGAGLQIVTAKDIQTTPDLRTGPAITGIGARPNARFLVYDSITAGDFNGDGQNEFAIVYHRGSSLILEVYSVDSTDLTIKFITSKTFAAAANFSKVIAMADDFDGTPNDQTGLPDDELVVAYQEGDTLKMVSFDISSDLQPEYKEFLNVSGFVAILGAAVSDRINWNSEDTSAQVVVAYNVYVGSTSGIMRLYDLDSKLQFSLAGNADIDSPVECGDPDTVNIYPQDLAIGNFDQQVDNETIIPARLQLAVLKASSCSTGNLMNVDILDITPKIGTTSDFSITRASSTPVSNVNNQLFTATLAVGDTQGRSLRIGPPEKLTIVSHSQPQTIIGVPPMHVDWIPLTGGQSSEIVNVSVFPNTFNSQYDFEESNTSQGSRKSTSSTTISYKEQVGESLKIKYSSPFGLLKGSVGEKVNLAWSQMHKKISDSDKNTYMSQTFDLSASTQFDDLISATTKQMNVYSYPVLGHCVQCNQEGQSCAQAEGTCPAGERPLFVHLSGPDNIIYLQMFGGSKIEWFQPVHEVGNVFSYPGSFAQLQADKPKAATTEKTRLQLLSSAEETLWDSQAKSQVKINWANSQGKDVTTGSAHTHSFDLTSSITASFKVGSVQGSVTGEFDYNKSTAISTLKTDITTYGASTGIVQNRGITSGNTRTDSYLYTGQTFIYGLHDPVGTFDNTEITNTTIKAQGPVTVGYAANPVSTDSGNWWRQVYQSPDVALNHPQRWSQLPPSGVNVQQVHFNCPVGYDATFDSPACTKNQNKANPDNVATKSFYLMKGLFVTPGDANKGPQITKAVLGNTVTLQARIYNYSLVNTPENTAINVRFYAQPWGNGAFKSAPDNPDSFANAVFIGEDTLDLIPAFCGGASSPGEDPCNDPDAPRNWVFATTQWDTSKLPESDADSYWKFWVVVWMESNNKLVAEISGHGLQSIPTENLTSLADVKTETYSNNLGFYNQVFALTATSEISAVADSVQIDTELLPPTSTIMLNKNTVVQANHIVTGDHLDDIMILFYDGDPQQGGKLFDIENIPRIQHDTPFITRVPYQPDSCGAHELFVQTIPSDGTIPPVMDYATFQVTIEPVAALRTLIKSVRKLDLPRWTKRRMVFILKLAKKKFRRHKVYAGLHLLERFGRVVERQRSRSVSEATADALLENVAHITACVKSDDFNPDHYFYSNK